MKRNTKGLLGVLEIAMIVVVVGILGFVGWKVTQGKDEETVDIASFDECVAAGYPILESDPEKCAVPGGETFTSIVPYPETTSANGEWTSATISELGATIDYPSAWGALTRNTEYEDTFVYYFSKFDGLEVDGSPKGTVAEGQGDAQLFAGYVVLDGKNQLRDWDGLVGLDNYFENHEYKITSNRNCAYTTNLDSYGYVSYHATCNLKKGDPLGFNIYTTYLKYENEVDTVNIDDFVELVESVEVN